MWLDGGAGAAERKQQVSRLVQGCFDGTEITEVELSLKTQVIMSFVGGTLAITS